jgi:glutamine cyclotransferase
MACNSVSDTSNTGGNVETKTTPVINYTLMGVYPHDTTAYTEGLAMHDGKLFESTGYTNELPQTRSLFGTLDLKTGKINPAVQLDTSKYFGEGITFLNNQWYQLTYRTKIGFVYAANTYKQLKTFQLPVKEGWGMTTDSTSLIMSDGTAVLTYVDPVALTAIKEITVRDESGPVTLLNELEYIDGFIYANIFTTAFIIKIDPISGNVLGKMDVSNLLAEQKTKFSGTELTNGIAYNPATKRIYITGKMWPNLYELAFTR